MRQLISTSLEINTRIWAFATLFLVAFFPLNWLDMIINFTLDLFWVIGLAIVNSLIMLVNFILGGLTALIGGLFDTIATLINNALPDSFNDPFPTGLSQSYTNITTITGNAPEVNIFEGGTLLTHILDAMGVKIPFGS